MSKSFTWETVPIEPEASTTRFAMSAWNLGWQQNVAHYMYIFGKSIVHILFKLLYNTKTQFSIVMYWNDRVRRSDMKFEHHDINVHIQFE